MGGDGLRLRFSILAKLLIAFLLPAAVSFAIFALIAHEVTRSELEAELGRRLESVAASAATQLRGKYLVDLLPGDEEELFYRNAERKLRQVQEATGVARIYVFDRDYRAAVTTDGLPIGATVFQAELDRVELERVFDREERASSVLFQGEDGAQYKAGYAPVFADPDKDRSIVLAIGVDAPATFFVRLEELRANLITYGVLLVVAIALVAVFVATLLTRPLRRLAEAAARIGRGDLEAPIESGARDEIGLLGETMERMRSDLRARDERMQLMLAGIAHEVRNPLGGMELYTGILRDELEPGDERAEHVERISRELGHLGRVVNDFLAYARRGKPEPALVDLAEVAGEVCDLEEGGVAAAGVELKRELGPARCHGDAEQLRRVFHNVIRNAVQAAGEGGHVSVATSDRDGAAMVVVENSGEPIPAEVREQMFEPFYTTREKGTGLGLAFVHEIVTDHGGTIDVTSGENGTAIAITIPNR